MTAILAGTKTTLPLLLDAARAAGIATLWATKSIWSGDRSVRIDVANTPTSAGEIHGVILSAGAPLGDDQPELLYGVAARSWRGFAADPCAAVAAGAAS